VNENKNLWLAIALSAMVLLGWSFLSEQLWPAPEPAPKSAPAQPGTPAAPAAPVRPTNLSLPQALANSPRIAVDTPRLKGSIALKGARIDDLVMVQQAQTIDKGSPPVRLFAPAGTRDAYFAQFGWSGQGVAVPDANTLWTASAQTLVPGKPVTLSWTNPTGQRFEQIISIDDGYLFEVKQRVVNLGTGAIGVRPYGLINRQTPSADPSTWTHHVGPISYLGGRADFEVDWETLDEDKAGMTRDSVGGWVGFTDKYWLAVLAPNARSAVEASLTKSGSAYEANYRAQNVVLAPRQATTTETALFAGAKEKRLLDRYENEGIDRLSNSIDWGWFEWFMRPIFNLLNWLFEVTRNFGVAIICLTFIVRLLMFPIADKQFRSMAGMRRVQPKMKELQERHKDDKVKLQESMLALYKEEKINPAAGCLPILLQIPVFYALYKVLSVSVEMRHQPFALWIEDLSAPDPLTPINLFGLLDFTPPSFLLIGVLPILLGVTMWMQFKLNPQQGDPVQQQIFGIMPWVLMVIMAPFAAGLQLYWVVSNILTIAQQKWLYYRYDHEVGDDAGKATVTVTAKK
jgi:YidC/Oxa1 family membrane protein insertase